MLGPGVAGRQHYSAKDLRQQYRDDFTPPQLVPVLLPLVLFWFAANQNVQDGRILLGGLNGGGLYNEGAVSFFSPSEFLANHGDVSAGRHREATRCCLWVGLARN